MIRVLTAWTHTHRFSSLPVDIFAKEEELFSSQPIRKRAPLEKTNQRNTKDHLSSWESKKRKMPDPSQAEKDLALRKQARTTKLRAEFNKLISNPHRQATMEGGHVVSSFQIHCYVIAFHLFLFYSSLTTGCNASRLCPWTTSITSDRHGNPLNGAFSDASSLSLSTLTS